MYTMKQTCQQVGMTYETLKFYCNEGLVPNVKRDQNNYRCFDEKDIAWLKGLQCLRKCGMSLNDMKRYMADCLKGKSSIPNRKQLLMETKQELMRRMEEINESIEYIDYKLKFYDDVLEGKVPYISNLLD